MINAIGFALFTGFLGCIGLILVSAIIGLVFAKSSQATPPECNTQSEAEAIVVSEYRSWAQLAPSGREVFFRPPPHINPVYEITFTGVLRSSERRADAFFETNGRGNFCRNSNGFCINGRHLYDLKYEQVHSDRCNHVYTIRIESWSREPLTLALDKPGFHGAIRADVLLLPEGTVGLEARWRHAETERALEKARRAEREAAVAAAAHFSETVKALTIRADLNRNWADPQYRADFARIHAAELINHQSEIRKDAAKLLEQNEIVSYFERHNPAVLAALLGHMEALLLAENITLGRAVAEADAPKAPLVQLPEARPKRKPSPAQEQRKKVREQKIRLGEKLALAKDRAATIEDVKAYVRSQYKGLDEDEQQRIVQQLLDEIQEENRNGKIL